MCRLRNRLAWTDCFRQGLLETMASPPGHATDLSMFEGLFDKMLKPQGAFAAALKTAGYDAAHTKPSCPSQVFTDCMTVAARHAFPQLGVDQAYRCLGRIFTEGFLKTIPGKLVNATMPMIGPKRFVQRIPM